MRNTVIALITVLLIIGILSCIRRNTNNQRFYFGNFEESKFGYFESFRHTNDKNFYFKLPFELKFGGIRPFPFDSTGNKEYSWLRNPSNLKIAFATVKLIGLEKFVSFKQYFEKNTDWCCDTQWENKSLNEIVKEFLLSDTLSKGEDYFSRFWQRRKKENNIFETWQIFQQIDNFYNRKKTLSSESNIDSTLFHLLDYNVKLINADSLNYSKLTLDYFKYLKKVKLDYSAFKLIFHNPKLNLPETFKDSLLLTLKYDTLSIEYWKKLDDNIDGWITGETNPDPLRNIGP